MTSSSAAQACARCGQRPVQICDECRRACALKWFSGISRHPESIEPGDVVCLVCEDGVASWCGVCWAEAVSEQRTLLREQVGREIGRWPDYPDTLMRDELILAAQAAEARARAAEQR